jgi:hypothetical protein
MRHLIGALLRSKLGAALIGAGSMAAVGSIAWASIPNDGGLITGCYQKTTGALRVIDTEHADCRANETALSWNQQGEQGDPGEPGEFTGYEVVRAEGARNADGVKTAVAYCPEGKRVLGGGVVAGEREGVAVTNTFPQNGLTGEPNSAWEGVVVRTDGFTGVWGIATFAICAAVDS